MLERAYAGLLCFLLAPGFSALAQTELNDERRLPVCSDYHRERTVVANFKEIKANQLGVQTTALKFAAAYEISSPENLFASIKLLRAQIATAKTADGRFVSWETVQPQGGRVRTRIGCSPEAVGAPHWNATAEYFASPPDPPRANGYQFVSAQALHSTATRREYIGLWRVPNTDTTHVVAFGRDGAFEVLATAPFRLNAISVLHDFHGVGLGVVVIGQGSRDRTARLLSYYWFPSTI